MHQPELSANAAKNAAPDVCFASNRLKGNNPALYFLHTVIGKLVEKSCKGLTNLLAYFPNILRFLTSLARSRTGNELCTDTALTELIFVHVL